ncbi:hypothetical protein GNF10_35530 [Nostoc sp. UCD121]|uniref:TRADD-N-associated membrane domain-containing protein n=1 Tax=unclassified Nostoc TaxID=2593658 RepID=UPI001625497D|nr:MULTISPECIES: hypothetical protein [unclassified Nostoc]MBC1225389.1 hypothetical protein [Nostoc sp. UCD120]MBC1281097.1 hypothetical protein [Nostoc sp. UCD121]
MQLKFFKKPQIDEKYSDIKEEIIRELLRQVRHSYNLAFGITTASALMTLLGVGLLYLDKISEASITTGGAALATIASVQRAKQAKEELREIIDELG